MFVKDGGEYVARAVIFMTEGNCNLKADRIEESETYIKVYDGDRFVGIFDLSVVRAAYVSGGEKT